MKDLLIIVAVALLIALLVWAPFALVWSLNVLFPVLAIPYTFSTWVASLFILSVLGGGAVAKISKK